MSAPPDPRDTAEIVRDALPATAGPVADIGCGRGALARSLAGTGRCVLALDPQAAALAHVRTGDGDGPVQPLAAGGEALPLADRCLAAAVYANALHHVPLAKQNRAVAEAARVLAPGGRLIAIEPLPEGPLFAVVRLVEDETAVRRAANAVLDAAVHGAPWRCISDTTVTRPVHQASFAAFREHILAVDPARAERLAAVEDALRATFDRLARPAAEGVWLDQPTRVAVLERVV
ncbi:pimeloyl-CoA biosynthesis protein BioC [Limimonas halophila]|uniref:Pimeloyl-CoA biosynthesis protein BioC n=1 Tax=Limimonas halophila TaxID=1082479 RepID=A0A1G7RFR3_9PROT|nr:class I SAM-dependent methyltransferase [Limimonas halophila]SDG09484.1 pimeloyl-CoA biosynthesis protein BioC [Limimonas halophila]